MTQSDSAQLSPAARSSLPAAARRWLERALPRELDLPTRIQLEQEGSMEVRGRWTRFAASGVYTVRRWASPGRHGCAFCQACGSRRMTGTGTAGAGVARNSGESSRWG